MSRIKLCRIATRDSNLQEEQVLHISELLHLSNSLTWLNLSNNKIVDISPLSNLPTSLTRLILNGNEIVDISVLSNLPNLLKHLYLSHNQIAISDAIDLIRRNLYLVRLYCYDDNNLLAKECENPNRGLVKCILAMMSPNNTQSSLRKFRQNRDFFGLIQNMLYKK
jgi:Leucine-rich repeat (LRR) protein